MLFEQQNTLFGIIQVKYHLTTLTDDNKEFIVDKKTNKKKDRIDKHAMYYIIANDLKWYFDQKNNFEKWLIDNKNVLPYNPMSDETYEKYDMHDNYYRGKYEYNKKIYESFNELKKENNLKEVNSYEYKKDITKEDKYRCKYCDDYEEFTGYNLTPKLARQQELIKHVFEKHPKEDLPRFGYFEYLIFDRFTQPIWSKSAALEINEYLKNNNVLILKSGTGTGKSVITPGLLLDCGFNKPNEEYKINCTDIISVYYTYYAYYKAYYEAYYEYDYGPIIDPNYCVICDDRFDDLKTHLNEYHKQVLCNTYDLTFYKYIMENVYDTQIIEALDEYKCPFCDKIKDVTRKELREHLKKKHIDKEYKFVYNKQIVCTQPRQLNAEGISGFVQKLLGSKPINGVVGYEHGDKKEPGIQLNYVTDGLLEKRFLNSSKEDIQKRYSCIIIDEVHERSISIDVLLAIINKIKDSGIKMIITSATFNEEKFTKYFFPKVSDLANHYRIIEGQPKYPINEKYLPNDSTDFILDTCNKALTLHEQNLDDLDKTEKDIIIFVDGQSTIRSMKTKFEEIITESNNPVAIMELTSKTLEDEKCLILEDKYDKLNNEKYKYPNFSSGPITRRIILATNTAETGITFKYAKYVIDTGLMNVSIYNPNTNAMTLVRSHITKNNMEQRRGRVGRTAPGEYHAMFTKDTYNSLKASNEPNIYISDITSIIPGIIKYVHLEDSYFNDIYDMNFIDPPSLISVNRGLSNLINCNAITHKLNITDFGNIMSLFRLSSCQVKSLVTSFKYHCSYEVSAIIALVATEANNGLYTHIGTKGMSAPHFKNTNSNYKSDHINLLITYLKYLNFKRAVNDEPKKLENWCIINYLEYANLRNADIKHQEILNVLTKNRFPILSFNTSNLNNNQINSILISLFSGHYTNTATKTDNMKYYQVDNTDIYAKSYKSLIYDANPGTHPIIPNHIFYSNLLLKNQNGIYTYYLSVISEYNPAWFGNVVPFSQPVPTKFIDKPNLNIFN